MSVPFAFGISELDDMFGSHGIDSQTCHRGTAAIVGPDGCGKSILALHLASNYIFRLKKKCGARVVYVSTDLSHEQASSQWRNFGLDYPLNREHSLRAAYDHDDQFKIDNEQRLELRKISPADSDTSCPTIAEFLWGSGEQSVYFLDLQSNTAGDDWGYVNSLLGMMANSAGENSPKHLFIIDAVEGLEAFSGNRDGYGLLRDRRSRVAQLIRSASRAGVHILFIVEESNQTERLPEQFVTDLVIRVRQVIDGTYSQRTIEIEKCRAVAHARGQHELAIRSGLGSSTGEYHHLDDPRILWWPRSEKIIIRSKRIIERRIEEGRLQNGILCINRLLPYVKTLAHIRVIPSLHRWARAVREQTAPFPELSGRAEFLGLDAIKELIPNPKSNAATDILSACDGSLTLLLGDSGTHKGRLARAFLAGAFKDIDSEQKNAAILITTRSTDHRILCNRLRRHLLGTDSTRAVQNINDHVFCQRLSIRHITSGTFLDIIERYIIAAQNKISGLSRYQLKSLSPTERRRISRGIRIVIEDLTELSGMYPALRNEPLLLQTFLFLLKQEGVNSLVVSTVPGPPGLQHPVHPQDIRSLDEQQIRTWNVPFFGDRRVALSFHPLDASGRNPRIIELRTLLSDDELLETTRDFDFFADVDLGQPKRVPLKLLLYSGTFDEANSQIEFSQFIRLLRDTMKDVFPGLPGEEALQLKPTSQYERIFTFVGTTGPEKLDHTLIFQIDEFWSQHAHFLANLTGYLNEANVSFCQLDAANSGRVIDAGSFINDDLNGIFVPFHDSFVDAPLESKIPRITSRVASGIIDAGHRLFQRKSFFVSAADGGPLLNRVCDGYIDRIPYVWDFGMILADKSLWSRHRDIKIFDSRRKTISIEEIWDLLCVPGAHFKTAVSPDQETPLEWQTFLEACKRIATEENTASFDVDLTTSESLSCLVFEIWASLSNTCTTSEFQSITNRESNDNKSSLWDLCDKHPVELLRSLLMLMHYCSHFEVLDRKILRRHASSRSAASREWYQTMSSLTRMPHEGNLVPLRLPGCFSVRGDWSLAMAAGSRSAVLGHRIIDLLSSRRQHLLRFREGFGLPPRDILPDCSIGDIPSAITYDDEKTNRRVAVSYRDICDLGARENMKWLWRSRLDNYDRDCFYWRRWIIRMIEDQHIWFPSSARQSNFDALFDVNNLNAVWSYVSTPTTAEHRQMIEADNNPPAQIVCSRFRRKLEVIKSALRRKSR